MQFGNSSPEVEQNQGGIQIVIHGRHNARSACRRLLWHVSEQLMRSCITMERVNGCGLKLSQNWRDCACLFAFHRFDGSSQYQPVRMQRCQKRPHVDFVKVCFDQNTCRLRRISEVTEHREQTSCSPARSDKWTCCYTLHSRAGACHENALCCVRHVPMSCAHIRPRDTIYIC